MGGSSECADDKYEGEGDALLRDADSSRHMSEARGLSPLKLCSRVSRSLGALHFLANAMIIIQTVPESAEALDGGSKQTAAQQMERDAGWAGARATVL